MQTRLTKEQAFQEMKRMFPPEEYKTLETLLSLCTGIYKVEIDNDEEPLLIMDKE